MTTYQKPLSYIPSLEYMDTASQNVIPTGSQRNGWFFS